MKTFLYAMLLFTSFLCGGILAAGLVILAVQQFLKGNNAYALACLAAAMLTASKLTQDARATFWK